MPLAYLLLLCKRDEKQAERGASLLYFTVKCRRIICVAAGLTHSHQDPEIDTLVA